MAELSKNTDTEVKVQAEVEANNTVDFEYIKLKLTAVNDLLAYLKGFNTADLSSILLEVYISIEKLNHFVFLCLIGKQDIKKIDESLWRNNYVLKFLYDDFIQYSDSKSEPKSVEKLYCSGCEVNFDHSSDGLITHVKSLNHYTNIFKPNESKFDDDVSWGNNTLLKLLFRQYTIHKETTNTFCCRICWSELNNKSDLIEHLSSLKHFINLQSIIEYKNLDSIKRPIESSHSGINKVISEANEIVGDGKSDTTMCSSSPASSKVVTNQYNLFMQELYDRHLNNKYNPIFCSICGYYQCTLDLLDCTPDRLAHEWTREHLAAISNIDSEVLVNFDWKFCEFCRAYFYCDDSFIKSHLDNEIHQSIALARHNNSNNSLNTVKNESVSDIIVKSEVSHAEVDVKNEVICAENNHEYSNDKQCTQSLFGVADEGVSESEATSVSNAERTIGNTSDSNNSCTYNGVTSIDTTVISDHDTMQRNLNILKKNLRHVMGTLLLKVRHPAEKEIIFYGYFCNLCEYWSNEITEWSSHINNSLQHKTLTNIHTGQLIRQCDCNIILVCDELFFHNHKSSHEHQNLVSFATKKLTKCPELPTDVNEDKKVEKPGLQQSLNFSELSELKVNKTATTDVTNNIINDLHNYNSNGNNKSEEEEEEDEDDMNFDNCSEVSSVVSLSSICSTRSLSRSYPRNSIGKFQSTCSSKKSTSNYTYVFGIRNLLIPTSHRDIVHGFSDLGTVKRSYFVDSTAANVVVTLSNISATNSFVSKNIIGSSVTIKGRVVTIERKILKNSKVLDFIKENFSNTRAFFKFIGSLESNAKAASRGQLHNTEVNLLPSLVNRDYYLKLDVKNSSPSITNVVIIGSRATGLACRDTVYDIFLEIEHNYFCKKTCDDVIKKRMAFLEECLRNANKFSNVRPRNNNGQRTISATHNKYNLNVKLYFTNGIVVENTELIRTYLHCDTRIGTLILLVKEWAKQTKVIDYVSQYAITWMVLFFLMTEEVKMIHSVSNFRLNSNFGRREIAGWNCRKCRLPISPPSRCDQTIYQLFCGFLLFYSSQEITRYVLCPLTGEKYAKSKFNNFVLPQPFARYIHLYSQYKNNQERFLITNGICLEDPIELNVNLTKNLGNSNLENFRLFCKKSLNELRTVNFKQFI